MLANTTSSGPAGNIWLVLWQFLHSPPFWAHPEYIPALAQPLWPFGTPLVSYKECCTPLHVILFPPPGSGIPNCFTPQVPQVLQQHWSFYYYYCFPYFLKTNEFLPSPPNYDHISSGYNDTNFPGKDVGALPYGQYSLPYCRVSTCHTLMTAFNYTIHIPLFEQLLYEAARYYTTEISFLILLL